MTKGVSERASVRAADFPLSAKKKTEGVVQTSPAGHGPRIWNDIYRPCWVQCLCIHKSPDINSGLTGSLLVCLKFAFWGGKWASETVNPACAELRRGASNWPARYPTNRSKSVYQIGAQSVQPFLKSWTDTLQVLTCKIGSNWLLHVTLLTSFSETSAILRKTSLARCACWLVTTRMSFHSYQ